MTHTDPLNLPFGHFLRSQFSWLVQSDGDLLSADNGAAHGGNGFCGFATFSWGTEYVEYLTFFWRSKAHKAITPTRALLVPHYTCTDDAADLLMSCQS